MRLVTKARRKLKQLGIPAELKHMRKLHPDFSLCASKETPGAYQIVWKRRPVGTARPLSMLPPAGEAACYIVASGPSLSDVDLSRLRGRVCFGVNGSIVKAAECGIPLDYFVVTDKNFARDRFELVKLGMASGASCIFSFRVLNEIAEREPSLLGSDKLFLIQEINARYGVAKLSPTAFDAWADGEPDLYLHESGRLTSGWVGFSKAVDKGVFTGQTVVYSAVQVACALGFRQVFILGMDLGGTGSLARFYESGSEVAASRLDKDFDPYIVPAFELARRLCEADGVALYNVSPDSRLPETIIPKIDFDTMLSTSNH
jgi:Kdo-III transferase WaaZ